MAKNVTKKVTEYDNSPSLNSYYYNHEVILSVDEIEILT